VSMDFSHEAYMRKDALNYKDVKPIPIPGQVATRRILVCGNSIILGMGEMKPGAPPPAVPLRHDFEEIVYVVSGTLEMTYPETGQKWIMTAGSCKLHPVNTAHVGKILGDEPVLVLEIRGPKIPFITP